MVLAAVATGPGTPLQLEDIELLGPREGHVRVRLAAAGVCHSDLSLLNGTLPHPMPAVLGHEGAGIVLEVGPGVDEVRAGDRVVLNWRPACGSCVYCAAGQPYLCPAGMRTARQPFARRPNGEDLFPGLAVAAFAEETVVPSAGVIPIPDDIALTTAALLGCAVLTGFGAVRNCARVRPGQSVLVLGAGGVGMMALQAARLHKAAPILAVDVNEEKKAQALACGATEFLVAGPRTIDEVRDLTRGAGVDHAIECVGGAEAIERAWAATRRGGVTTVVGAGGSDERVSFTALDLFHSARSLVGCLHGNAHLARDLPELLRYVRSGELDPTAVVTDWISMDEIPDAFGRLAECRGGRSVVTYGVDGPHKPASNKVGRKQPVPVDRHRGSPS